MVAIRQVQNAGHWIIRDAQMAEEVAIDESSGFPIVLSRTKYDGTQYEVTYVEDLQVPGGRMTTPSDTCRQG